MKLLILFSLLFTFGCAQVPVLAPVITPAVIPGSVSTIPSDCIQSKTSDHSYQSAVDPKDVFDNWTEVPELRKGDWMLRQRPYRNPDFDSDIPVVLLVFQTGKVIGYFLLQAGEPKTFVLDRMTKCYMEGENSPRGSKVLHG